MKKIGLITIHRVLNYGTAWQVYSTVQLLQAYNKNVTVIDYIPKRLKIARMRDFLFEVNPAYKRSWKLIPYLFLRVPTRFLEKRVFDRFINTRIPLTKKKFFLSEELTELNDDFDIFVTGSDQVWNYEEELHGYTGALKAPVRCFGNHLSGKGKSSFQTDNECGGAAILKK